MLNGPAPSKGPVTLPESLTKKLSLPEQQVGVPGGLSVVVQPSRPSTPAVKSLLERKLTGLSERLTIAWAPSVKVTLAVSSWMPLNACVCPGEPLTDLSAA